MRALTAKVKGATPQSATRGRCIAAPPAGNWRNHASVYPAKAA
ncbi:hypothetical protein EIO_0077 [Ketogulonicigenium vulgare Y25]|nr:hypothetical protein EIO_0077 [Ketogulonicigenium vulgare Y25]